MSEPSSDEAKFRRAVIALEEIIEEVELGKIIRHKSVQI